MDDQQEYCVVCGFTSDCECIDCDEPLCHRCAAFNGERCNKCRVRRGENPNVRIGFDG